jgi:hypothetical protein
MSKTRAPAKDSRVVWLDRGWQPTSFGFCPSKRAWKREMKRLGCEGEAYPTTAGRCTTFDTKAGKTCVIVTISAKIAAEHSRVEVAGILCHEATHVWQQIQSAMGEDRPSIEFEAYSMQAIFQGLYQAWLDTMAPDEMKAAHARNETA